MDRAAVVLQARMGSTRFPGKSLARINGRSLLARAVERLQVSGLPVVVATTTDAEDDAIESAACQAGAEVTRGSASDVLGRFAQVVRERQLDLVVRATADNPGVDMEAAERTLALLRSTGVDYVCERGLPLGAAVEAMTGEALVQAAAWAEDAYDREHVTPFIRRDRRFAALVAIAPGRLQAPRLRLTVDTAEDFEWVGRVITAAEESGPLPAPLQALIWTARDLEGLGLAADGQTGGVSHG